MTPRIPRSLALALALASATSHALPQPAAAQPEVGTVTVQPGDNLFRIALRYGTTVEALMRANQLASPDWITAGQRLALAPRPTHRPMPAVAPSPALPAPSPALPAPHTPDLAPSPPTDSPLFDPAPPPAPPPAPLAAPVAAPPTAPVTPETDAPPAGQYVVQPGDNLFRIALRHGTSVNALTRLNGLASADVIAAGQILKLPGNDNANDTDPASPTDANPDAAQPGSGGIGAPPPAPPGRGAREIVIDLSDQTLTAFEGGTPVRRVVVSTGKPATPTPVGFYRIYSRYHSQDMAGPGYYAPDVPFVQYFIGGYAIHGTYWHTAFGTPVSHGCVNLPTPDAEWMWGWAGIGTPVTVQW